MNISTNKCVSLAFKLLAFWTRILRLKDVVLLIELAIEFYNIILHDYFIYFVYSLYLLKYINIRDLFMYCSIIIVKYLGVLIVLFIDPVKQS